MLPISMLIKSLVGVKLTKGVVSEILSVYKIENPTLTSLSKMTTKKGLVSEISRINAERRYNVAVENYRQQVLDRAIDAFVRTTESDYTSNITYIISELKSPETMTATQINKEFSKLLARTKANTLKPQMDSLQRMTSKLKSQGFDETAKSLRALLNSRDPQKRQVLIESIKSGDIFSLLKEYYNEETHMFELNDDKTLKKMIDNLTSKSGIEHTNNLIKIYENQKANLTESFKSLIFQQKVRKLTPQAFARSLSRNWTKRKSKKK
jgi:hypothetical protein